MKRTENTARWVWWIPALFTLVVCLWKLSGASLWSDELATWLAADRSLSDLFAMLPHLDAVLGVYYVFMHFWIALFGDSEFSLRLPSALAMAAAAGLLAALTRRIMNSASPDTPQIAARAGLAAGVLFGLTPTISRFGQEARVYAVVVALAIAATYVLVVTLEKPTRWRWVGYGALIVGLGYAHLVGLTLLGAHAVALVLYWNRHGRPRALLWGWILSAGIAVALTTPIMILGAGQRQQVAWNPTPRLLALTEFPNELYGLGVIAGAIVGLALWAALTDRVGQWLPLLVAWAVIPPIALFLAARVVSLWNPRYVLFAAPALIALGACALAQLSWRKIAVALSVVALLGLTHQIDLRRSDGHVDMDGRAVAKLIRENQRPGDVAIYSRNDVWGARASVAYYMGDDAPPDVLADGTPADAKKFIPKECKKIATCLDDAPRLWVVRWGRYAHDPLFWMDGHKADLIYEHYNQVRIWEAKAMTVILYEKKPSTS
ncbi:MAG: DUF2723 domain-containing protein [Corynebacteriales bacterium]|nr:DUF2723 domain-containing protein [Mycobacteriales bacterium]